MNKIFIMIMILFSSNIFAGNEITIISCLSAENSKSIASVNYDKDKSSLTFHSGDYSVTKLNYTHTKETLTYYLDGRVSLKIFFNKSKKRIGNKEYLEGLLERPRLQHKVFCREN